MRTIAACVGLLLGAGTLAAAGVELRLEDIGVRRHVRGQGETTLVLRLDNYEDRAFLGEIVARPTRRTGLFSEDTVSSRVAAAVDVPARGTSTVCLAVEAAGGSEPLVVQAFDRDGVAQAAARVDWHEAGVAWSEGQLLVGLLTASIPDTQALHEAILFPRDGNSDAVAPPRLKLLSLTSLPPCAEALRELSFLVVAVPAGALGAGQRRVIEEAVERGLHVIVAGEQQAALYTELPLGNVRQRGLGSVQRIASAGDAAAFSRLRTAGSQQPAEAQSVLGAQSPDAILDPESWLRGRFRQPRLPSIAWLGAALGAYVLVIGPLGFFYLRARDRRERGWLLLPLAAAAATAALAGWLSTYEFPALELNVARWAFSRDGAALGRQLAQLHVASPRRETLAVRVQGPWSMDSPAFRRTPFDVEHGRDSLRLAGIAAPRWSTHDFVLSSVGPARAPVSWEGNALRNELALPFAEAVLLRGERVFTLGRIAPAARRVLDEQAAHAIVPQPLRLRREGATSLDETLAFEDRDQVRRLMSGVRGVFLGVVEEDTSWISLEPPVQSRRGLAVYVHVFEGTAP